MSVARSADYQHAYAPLLDARGIDSTLGSCQPGDAQVVFADGLMRGTVTTTALGKVLR